MWRSTLANSGSERVAGEGGNGSGSGSGSGSRSREGSGQRDSNNNSTPGTSLHSGSASGSFSGSFVGSGTGTSSGSGSTTSQFRPPPVDTRRQYKGFSFIFATDAQHARETVYGDETGGCIHYLKPTHQGETIDHLPPVRLPYFFTGFDWKDVDGKQCSMSRVKLCDAWQIAFNRLIYYASFLEEKSVALDAADVKIFKEEFTVWNDLFCELDQTLGRLVQCEIAHVLPKFKASMDLEDLTNPNNLTDPKTPFDQLNSTFLCAAREILEKHARENESPPDHIQEIERNTKGWEPCTGYSVIQATGWNDDRYNSRNDIVREGEDEGAGEVDQGSHE